MLRLRYWTITGEVQERWFPLTMTSLLLQLQDLVWVRYIPMWMVLYTREFGLNEDEDKEIKKYLDPFNGVIMWTWEERDVPLIPEKFEILKKLTPNQRHMFGCYLYNFGEKKQATAKAVKWQLDYYREKILCGEAEGVVLHTNTMADMDFEAHDAAIKWLVEHGDEEVD